MPNAIISVRNLSLKYPGVDHGRMALSNITMDFELGYVTVLAGPSGSGKSSLLGCLCGLKSPTSGEIYFGERNVTRISQSEWAKLRRNTIHVVTQQVILIPYLTVWENLCLVIDKQNKDSLENAKYLLQKVGLESMCNRYPKELSVGGRQRVAVIRSMLGNPQVILADEPTAALDRANSEIVMQLFEEIARKRGIAVILSTHDQVIFDRGHVIYHLRDGTQSNFEDNRHSSLEFGKSDRQLKVGVYVGQNNQVQGRVRI